METPETMDIVDLSCLETNKPLRCQVTKTLRNDGEQQR